MWTSLTRYPFDLPKLIRNTDYFRCVVWNRPQAMCFIVSPPTNSRRENTADLVSEGRPAPGRPFADFVGAATSPSKRVVMSDAMEPSPDRVEECLKYGRGRLHTIGPPLPTMRVMQILSHKVDLMEAKPTRRRLRMSDHSPLTLPSASTDRRIEIIPVSR